MITYVLNLNSHWQLRCCCSWRRRADLHIHCECRDRGEFYWPERMICIKESKQGCSDLSEYSAGSKGTGLELCGIITINANRVPLCALLRPVYTSGTGERDSCSCSSLIYGIEKSLLQPLGTASWKKKNNKRENNRLQHRKSQKFHLHIFRASGTLGHSLGERFTVFAFRNEPSETTPGNDQRTILLSFSPLPLPPLSVSEKLLSGDTCSW